MQNWCSKGSKLHSTVLCLSLIGSKALTKAPMGALKGCLLLFLMKQQGYPPSNYIYRLEMKSAGHQRLTSVLLLCVTVSGAGKMMHGCNNRPGTCNLEVFFIFYEAGEADRCSSRVNSHHRQLSVHSGRRGGLKKPSG